MYFLKEKRLLVVFLAMAQSFSSFSQTGRNVVDTLLIQKDSVVVDTIIAKPRKVSINAIDSKVTYSALGYKKVDIINKNVVLVSAAKVNYGEIEIKADSILINMKTNLLFAIGRSDTSGKVIGKPQFKEGAQEFEADELTYNFKTRKALIKNIVTKQEDGLLHSAYTKLLEDGTSNISKSTYSTCDADTPHYYINLPRAKVYPGVKIISGPANLVVEGIPLPLFIPFGYFPVQTKRAASGLIIPRFGEEQLRGYSLTDGGYYFAISNYFDLSIKGSIYANGSWIATATTNYNKLYKYSGNFSFNYANNIAGHLGLPDYNKSTNYRLGWNYSQDPKSSPGSRFTASVNMSSSGYDVNNSYNVSEHVTTQRQSSVSYSKSWEGTPFNLSTSMNQSQNVRNKTVFLNLPKANFNVGRIYPLKGKNSTGQTKWYQELQLSYTATLDNQINTTDSLLFTRSVLKNMNNGFKHEVPLSLQLRPFRNFSISPSLTYTGVLYSQKIEKRWDANYFDPDKNVIVPSVINDTIRGVFYGQAINPSISASYNPQLFGTFLFTNPNSRLQSIRHVIKPSVGFIFIPAYSGFSSKMYRQVQTDFTGRMTEYSIYENNIYGTPSLSSKSGNISFGLSNIIEAKVFAKNDSTGKAKKIKIIDNFSINTSYNIFADSMKWAPVNIQIRTTILNNVNISGSGTFSLYGIDNAGRPIARFAYNQNNTLLRLTNLSMGLDFSLSELLKRNKKKTTTNPSQNALTQSLDGNLEMNGPNSLTQPNQGEVARDSYGYPVFDVPWSMNVSYSLNYVKTGLTTAVSQGLILVGNVSITKKMSISYSSGYDFTGKEITMTQIGINRDLHCWEMSFNWIPNGTMQGWNFALRIKSAIFSDLKYERRKDYHDNQ